MAVRACPKCGSVAVKPSAARWSCSRCGHVARRFPELHRQEGADPCEDARVSLGAGGYVRRSAWTADE